MNTYEELLQGVVNGVYSALQRARSDSFREGANELKAEIIPRLKEINELCADVASEIQSSNEYATEAHNVLWGKVKRLLHDMKQESK